MEGTLGYGDCPVALALVWARTEVVEWACTANLCHIPSMRMASLT